MGIVLYHLDASPPSRSVLMTLKALKLEFEIKPVDLFAGEHKKPEYLKINPRGKVPALVDGKLQLSESRAIIQYLINKYAKGADKALYPDDPDKRVLVDMELYISEIVFEAFLGLNPPAMLLKGEKPSKEKVEAVQKCLKDINDRLEGKQYLAGNTLTIADFSSYASVVFIKILIDDMGKIPNVEAWMQRMQKLPYDDEVNGQVMKKLAVMLQEKLNPKKQTQF